MRLIYLCIFFLSFDLHAIEHRNFINEKDCVAFHEFDKFVGEFADQSIQVGVVTMEKSLVDTVKKSIRGTIRGTSTL